MPIADASQGTNATIGAGAALSGAVSLSGMTVVGIVMPAAWTAAVLTFQASRDNVTFEDVWTAAGVEYSVTAAAAHYVVISPDIFVGAEWIKVRSGTGAAPVNQVAQAVVGLITTVL